MSLGSCLRMMGLSQRRNYEGTPIAFMMLLLDFRWVEQCLRHSHVASRFFLFLFLCFFGRAIRIHTPD